MRHILLRKRVFLESHDFCTFWEISGNISEKVQDTDIVAIED